MNIPHQLAPYAANLGFPGSEAMAKILTILFDDPDSVVVAGALPGSVQDISTRTGLSEQRVSRIADRLLHKVALSRVISKGQYYRLFPDGRNLSSRESTPCLSKLAPLLSKERTGEICFYLEVFIADRTLSNPSWPPFSKGRNLLIMVVSKIKYNPQGLEHE